MHVHLQLPEEARELDKELRGITKDKNESVRGQDFEKVISSLTIFEESIAISASTLSLNFTFWDCRDWDFHCSCLNLKSSRL